MIDENFVFPPLKGATKQNLTTWEEHEIPPIEMSPYQKAFFVEFAVYRDGVNIGLGKSAIAYGDSKKGSHIVTQIASIRSIKITIFLARFLLRPTGSTRKERESI